MNLKVNEKKNKAELIKKYIKEWYFIVPAIVSVHETDEQKIWSGNDKSAIATLYRFIQAIGKIPWIYEYRELYVNESDVIVYFGDKNKTKNERDTVLSEFSPSILSIYDDSEDGNFDKIFLGALRKKISLKAFVPSLIYFYRVIYWHYKGVFSVQETVSLIEAGKYLKLYRVLMPIIKKDKKVLNMFPGTIIGAIINNLAKKSGALVYNYSYGSNALSLEQEYIIGDHFLVKDSDDPRLFKDKEYRYVIQNLDKSIIIRNPIDKRVVLIDTCETHGFGLQEKINFYKEIFSKLNGMQIIVCWHPGSKSRKEISDHFQNVRFSTETMDEILSAKYIIDICSTLQNLLTRSRVPYISIAKIFFDRYKKIEVPYFFLRQTGLMLNFLDEMEDLLANSKEVIPPGSSSNLTVADVVFGSEKYIVKS